jgi:hypothetical protein
MLRSKQRGVQSTVRRDVTSGGSRQVGSTAPYAFCPSVAMVAIDREGDGAFVCVQRCLEGTFHRNWDCSGQPVALSAARRPRSALRGSTELAEVRPQNVPAVVPRAENWGRIEAIRPQPPDDSGERSPRRIGLMMLNCKTHCCSDSCRYGHELGFERPVDRPWDRSRLRRRQKKDRRWDRLYFQALLSACQKSRHCALWAVLHPHADPSGQHVQLPPLQWHSKFCVRSHVSQLPFPGPFPGGPAGKSSSDRSTFRNAADSRGYLTTARI